MFSVLGPVNCRNLGRTLTHEHFSLDFTKFYRAPPEHLEDHFDGKIVLENVGYVKQMPYSSKDNLKFEGTESNKAVLNDVYAYKKYGGGILFL